MENEEFILSAIQKVMPEKYNEFLLYIHRDPFGGTTTKFYVKEREKYIDCYNLKNVSQNDLINTFVFINKRASEILQGNSSLIFIFENSNIKTKFIKNDSNVPPFEYDLYIRKNFLHL